VARTESFVFLPLRTHQAFGLLLGSDDPGASIRGWERYLTRLAELQRGYRAIPAAGLRSC
jgi:hypothetical protein